MKKSTLVLICIILGLIIFILMDKFVCNRVAVPTNDKHENDSLKSVIADLSKSTQYITDSLNEVNSSLAIDRNEADKERKRLINELYVLKNKHEEQKKDTVLSNECCEKLSSQTFDFDNYISTSDSEHTVSDSIISYQQKTISNDSIILASQLKFNQELKNDFNKVTDNYDNLLKYSTKQAKNIKWQKIKQNGLLGIVGVLLIKMAFKK